jgi:hypothetical protein
MILVFVKDPSPVDEQTESAVPRRSALYAPAMPRYLVIRAFQVGADQMPGVGRRSRELVDGKFPQIVWEHSHVVVDDDGRVFTYCVYDAPDEETVREHSKMLGEHTIEGLHEIAGDVAPSDFPPVAA